MFNLKVAVSEDVQNCADEGIQIYGGMGFSEDSMESAWRPNCSYL
jgi:alkylation response protein AidB-like acyl-CoA dehydrogenase